jgi:c-di-GMP-binding flagellar brake protein YcgR
MSYMNQLSVAGFRMNERRWEPRVGLKVRLHEVLGEHVVPSVAVDMSEGGLQVRRLVEPGARDARLVGVELALPGTGDVIWASVETQFEQEDQGLHRAGLRFLEMARRHRRLLRDFLWDRRLRLIALG